MYYVGSDGRMLTNTITPDGYWVGSDGKWISSIGITGSGAHNISSWSTERIGNTIVEHYNRTYNPKGSYTYTDQSFDRQKTKKGYILTIRYEKADEEQGATPEANVAADEVEVNTSTGWAQSLYENNGWYIW